MTNSVKRIILGGFDSPIPADVVELDILYKEDDNASIYKVESLSPEDLSINYVEHEITNNSSATVSFEFTNVFSVFIILFIVCCTGSYLASKTSLQVKL